MNLLLDTHALLALARGETKVLGRRVEAVLCDPGHKLHVSVASLWEIAIKHRLGKLRVLPSLDEWPDLIASMGIDILPVSALHVLANVEPEPPTRDPFDRLLLAQCKVEGLRLVTIDRALVGHPYAMTA
jgi:PIN domain nuclease of toxin-antitoxin system